MDWAFWVGTTIFAGTVGGMLWMHNHPVDVDGCGSLSLDRPTRTVLDELIDYRVPRSAFELRRRVRLSPDRFNDVIGRMILDGLVKWRPSTIHPPGRYELTEAGISRALGLDRAVGRGRHRA